MLLKIIKRLFNRNTKVKECEPSEEEIEKLIEAEINAKLDKVLKLADNNGFTYLRHEHIKPLLTMPGAFNKENEKQLLVLLRDIDIKMRVAWEEQVNAYIRIPVQSVYGNSGAPYFPWR